MDNLNHYRKIIRELIEEYAQITNCANFHELHELHITHYALRITHPA